MTEKLSSFALIAEIIAGIGVIVSLLFVGLELSEGNRETRAATMQAATDSEMALQAQFLRYPDILERINRGDSIEAGAEQRQAIVLYNMIMTEFENRYFQYQAGYLDTPVWERRLQGMRRIASFPIYEVWVHSPGAVMHSPSFLELLQQIRSEEA